MPHREATIEIASLKGGPVLFRLLNREGRFVGSQYSTLDFNAKNLPPLNCAANLTLYGTRLMSALSADTDVGRELAEIFRTAPPDIATLEFAISEASGELFRWETLYDSPLPLALRTPCSLKRTAYAGATRGTRLRLFAAPIRMVAFLSAIGINSKGEFRAITAAIAHAQSLGLKIETTIYLGEQSLLDMANAQIKAGAHKDLTVLPMPADSIAVEQALTAQPVQIVHFGCHGQVQAGVHLLEFGSISDHDTEELVGSVHLSIDRLVAALQSSNTVWLTVLNSCSGAQAAPRLSSMAHTLAKNASPVAVGMAEPIFDQDAQLFAEGFYKPALEAIAHAIKGLAVGGKVAIDLGPAIGHARSMLAMPQPGLPAVRQGRWCLPILCQRDTGLRVAQVADAEMALRIETVAGLLRGFPTNSPEDLRRQILGLLDKDPAVPMTLRPDLFGNLS